METGLLLLAALIVGMSKGGLASAGAIAVPMLALVMNPVTAAATLLPVYIVTDWVGIYLYRKHASWPNVRILVTGILIGVAIATVITPWTPESALLIFTGCIGLWYCWRAWLKRGTAEPTLPSWRVGLPWSVITGIASFITHSGAPPSQAYLLPQRLPKLQFAGTIAIAFAVGNLVKLPAYWSIGQLDGLNWPVIAGLAVAGVVGTLIGRWLTHQLPEPVFLKVIQSLLLVLSVVLLGKGGAELLTLSGS